MEDLSKYRILVVDDDPDILLVMETFLAHEGFSVVTARNGLEAVQKAKIHNPDLVVVDMAMPGLDGIAALREIRKLYPQVRSVMVTAYRDAEKVVEAFRTGCGDCLFKPFNMKDLKNSIVTKLRIPHSL